MKGKRKPDSSNFLNEAEKIIREYAGKNPRLVVWRGEYVRELFKSKYIYDTIIVGLSDRQNSALPPDVIILKVWLEIAAEIYFSIGSDDVTHESVPFGGWWVPLDQVRRYAKKLPNII